MAKKRQKGTPYKCYTVYKNGVLVIEKGTAEECARALGLKSTMIFYEKVYQVRNSIRSRYTIDTHYIAGLERQKRS